MPTKYGFCGCDAGLATRRYRYFAPPELEEVWVAGCVYRYGTPNGVWREDGVRVFSPVGTIYR